LSLGLSMLMNVVICFLVMCGSASVEMVVLMLVVVWVLETFV